MRVHILWAAGSPSGTILVEENHHASNEVLQNRFSLTPIYSRSRFYFECVHMECVNVLPNKVFWAKYYQNCKKTKPQKAEAF